MTPVFEPTRIQQDFLSIAPWFFGDNPRRSGRSMAITMYLIQEAIAGHEVYLYDPSVLPLHGIRHATHHRFAEEVVRYARRYFPDHDFEFNRMRHSLRCLGIKYLKLPEGM